MPTPVTLVLEPLQSGHAREMFAGLSDPAGYRFLADEPPDTLQALEDRYARQTAGGSADGAEIWLNWIVRQGQSGQAVGYTQATIHAGSALLGYHIVPAYWHRGIGSLAVRIMIDILFSRTDVDDVWALVDTRNHPSIALLRRLGFGVSRTIIAADHFKGSDSDEHEFVMSIAEWQSRGC